MSYNVVVCTPPVAAEDQTAWDELNSLIDTTGPVAPELKELYDRLTSKYPCICSLPEDDVDDGVWSDGPLWNNFGQRAAVLGMIFSRVDEVYPFLIKTANDLGLTVFDWAGPVIHRPSGWWRRLFGR